MKKIHLVIGIIIATLVSIIPINIAKYETEKTVDIMNVNIDQSYKVSFDSMVIGTLTNEQSSKYVKKNTQLGTLPEPDTRPGYTFDGWYENIFNFDKISTSGNNFELISLENEELTAKAKGTDMYIGFANKSSEPRVSYNERYGPLIEIDQSQPLSFYLTNPAFNKNYFVFWDEDLNQVESTALRCKHFNTNYGTFSNIPSDAKYVTFRLGVQNSIDGQIYSTKILIKRGGGTNRWVSYNQKAKPTDIINSDTEYFARYNKNKYNVTFISEDLMEGKTLNVTGTDVSSYDSINKIYTIDRTWFSYGYYIDPIFENDNRYVLSYKAQKVNGTLYNLHGHAYSTKDEVFTIDNIIQSDRYSDISKNIEDDTNIHDVYFSFIYDNKDNIYSDKKIYIQPNRIPVYDEAGHIAESQRDKYLKVKMKIWDVHLYKTYDSYIKEYNEKINTIPIAENKDGYIFVGWFDDNGNQATSDTKVTESVVYKPKYVKDTTVYTVAFQTEDLASDIHLWTGEDDIATLENGVWTVTRGHGANGGLEISTPLTNNHNYILSYKLQKVSGTLKGIHGHATAMTNEVFKINDEVQSTTYHGDTPNVEDSSEVFNVEYQFTYSQGGDTANNRLYIQPNRGNRGTVVPLTTKIWDIHLYELAGENKQLTYGQKYGELPTPIKDSHEFLGWYDDNDNKATSETITTKSITYHAKWKKLYKRIQLWKSEEMNVSSTIYYQDNKVKDNINGNIITSISIPTRSEYIFGGYWTRPNGTGKEYINPDGTFRGNWDELEHGTALYAYWYKPYVEKMLTYTSQTGEYTMIADCTGVKNWQNLTLDNFFIAFNDFTVMNTKFKEIEDVNIYATNYNAETGKLTIHRDSVCSKGVQFSFDIWAAVDVIPTKVGTIELDTSNNFKSIYIGSDRVIPVIKNWYVLNQATGKTYEIKKTEKFEDGYYRVSRTGLAADYAKLTLDIYTW